MHRVTLSLPCCSFRSTCLPSRVAFSSFSSLSVKVKILVFPILDLRHHPPPPPPPLMALFTSIKNMLMMSSANFYCLCYSIKTERDTDTDSCHEQDAIDETPHREKVVHFWYPSCYKSPQGLDPSADQQELRAQTSGREKLMVRQRSG